MKMNLPLPKQLFKALVLIIILSVSCTPQKRLNRLISKHPNLIAYIDTIRDTTIFNTIKIDSIFMARPGDTIVIELERLRTEFIRMGIDTFKIQTQKQADTIIKQIPVPVVKTQMTVQKKNSFWQGLSIGILAVLFVVLVATRVLRR